jgi:hypothetical protein
MAGAVSRANSGQYGHAGSRGRACSGGPFLPLPLVLPCPDNELSRRVPAVSRLIYAEWKTETPYWSRFPAFVPVVPVVPTQNSRGRSETPRNRRRVEGAAESALRQKKPCRTDKARAAKRDGSLWGFQMGGSIRVR